MSTVRILRLSFLFVLLVGARAFAQSCPVGGFDWTGAAGDNDFNNPLNWSPAGFGAGGEDACFTSTATPNLSVSYTVNSLRFLAGSNVTITSSPFRTLQVNGGGIVRAGTGAFNINPDTLFLGASQPWSITAGGGASVVTAPLAGVSQTEVVTKTGTGDVTLSGSSATFGGIDWTGGTLTVTVTNALGSGTPVTLRTGGSLLLNAASALNLNNDVTLNGAVSPIVGVQSSTAGTRHSLGGLTVASGTTAIETTRGATNSSLQISSLTLNGTAVLSKTNINGGLWVAGPVTSTSAATVSLQLGITTPIPTQYDEGLHFTSTATLAAGISTSGNSNSAIIGADGATTATLTGPISFGSGNPRAILIARSGGRLIFAPSSFGSTNQDTQIRGDATGTVEFASSAASANNVSVFDATSFQTDLNPPPSQITFSTTNGATWLVRNVAQTLAGTGSVVMGANASIDTGVDLTLNGALNGSGNLTKIGAGALTLTDFNNYAGTFNVNAGTLRLSSLSNNGSVAINVASGATLTGNGGASNAPSVFAANSILTPGSGGTGTLRLGNTTLNDTTTLNFTVGTSTTTVTTGTLALDGVLNINAGPGFAQGNFTLFSASTPPTNGGLRLGTAPATNSYAYDITGNNVILTVGPPATAVELVKLDALTDGTATQVTWEAGTEIRNLGYRIHREENGRRRDVSGLVPGSALRAGFDPLAGRNYAFIDGTAAIGGRYWLEAIDMRGRSQWFGPVDAHRAPGATFRVAPAALRAPPSSSASLLARDTSSARQVDFPGVDRSWRDPSLASQWRVAASTGAVKLLVRKDGVYRVTADQLLRAGLPAGTSLDSVQLWAGGRQVAHRLSPSGDAIEFFGQAADTRYTDTRVYWVTTGLGRPAFIAPAAATDVNARQTSFLETLEIRDRTTHIAALLNPDTDGFFGKFLLGAQPLERIFSTPALAVQASDSAVLQVSVQGLTNGEHTIDVRVNGLGVGTLHGVFQDVATASFTLPPGVLLPGDNSVVLVGRTDDEIAVELSQRLTYPRQYSLSGALRFTAPAGTDLILSGADSSTRVLDITSVLHPTAVATSAASGGLRLVAGGTGTRILYAYRDQDVLSPALSANVPSSWHAAPGADLVVIGTRELLPSLRPLVEQRTREGLRVAVVDVEDVYDEFSAGEKDAMAIRSFLSNAVRTWRAPPSFVLLAGSATYDPRGWLGRAELDQVPTVLVQTRYLQTASDDALVTFDPATGPALAVGRLPLSTTEDMDAAVAKILGRRLATKDQPLLLVRDRDGEVSFSAASAEVRSAFTAWKTQDFARGADDGATHTDLIEALRSAPIAVDFQGHGAEDFWAGRILSATDADALAGTGSSSLLVAATCLNAYFLDIGREALGSALLRTPDGGAWGVWASSAMTLPTEHGLFSKTLLSAALKEGLTLGEATLEAKRAVTDPELRSSFHLLGDPSARAVATRRSALSIGPSRDAGGGCSTPGGPLAALAPLVLAALVLSLRRRRSS